ncbi:MAG: hypothetical protein LBC75_00645 [Fibromonadaceae bacterium]|jgi:hypothetical protein|nr:hypothetical protein [Fibromonadaceae bacterium]
MEKKEVDYLLALPKRVKLHDILEDSITFDRPVLFQQKYKLGSPMDDNYTFLYEINQSPKVNLKLTLYLMDNETKIGLLRIDFNGQHQNPEEVIKDLPKDLLPFAGKLFDYNEPHIHYHVDGYKQMAWAKPAKGNFPVSDITSQDDIISAFYEFNTMIALETRFTINPILL